MKRRPTPINERGLVTSVPPKECSRQECPYVQVHDFAPNRHHRWFSLPMYERDGPDSLPWQLRRSPFNLEPPGRVCQHLGWHNGHYPPNFPKKGIIEGVVDESRVLERLADLAIILAERELKIERLRALGQLSRGQSERLAWHEESYESYWSQAVDLAPLVQEAELLHGEALTNPFSYVHRQDRESFRIRGAQIIQGLITVPVETVLAEETIAA